MGHELYFPLDVGTASASPEFAKFGKRTLIHGPDALVDLARDAAALRQYHELLRKAQGALTSGDTVSVAYPADWAASDLTRFTIPLPSDLVRQHVRGEVEKARVDARKALIALRDAAVKALETL